MQMSDLRKDIAQHIDTLSEDSACVLMDLIRFPSVCGEEMEAVNFMKEVLISAGLNARIIPMNPEIKSHPEYTHYSSEPEWEGRGNLVTVYGGNGSGKSLILNAHIE